MGDRIFEDTPSVEVEFLGGTIRLPTGPYEIASVLRCPIYFTTALHTEPNRYTLHCEPFAQQVQLPRKARKEALAAYDGLLGRCDESDSLARIHLGKLRSLRRLGRTEEAIGLAETAPASVENRPRLMASFLCTRADLYREFQRSLERAGYKHDRDGKEHDPPGDTHSGVFKQGPDEILLTVTAAPGGADARVQLQKLD